MTELVGKQISRDASGNPTGIFLEDSENLISSIIPKNDPQDIRRAIINGMKALVKFGVTGVHDFDSFDRLAIYQQLECDGLLQLRILKSIPPDDHRDALAAGCQTGKGSQLVHIGAYKFFMDGALGPRTAAMLSPYQNDPNNQGILNHKAEDLVEQSRVILETGSDLSIHAIGDRANLEAIKAFQLIREFEKINRRKPVKLRIEHAQLLSAEILSEFRKYDIYASMQPLHATSDMEMADKYWGKRSRLAYAWKSLLSQGTRLVFGSDAPVESPDPFLGLHASVTRQRTNNLPADSGWIPEERITLQEALHAYTRVPAELNRFGAPTGSLEPGFAADLILLDIDPFKERAQELHHIKPVATMFAGQWVWVAQGVKL